MNKKKGIIFFIISIVIILLCCFTTIFGFGSGKVGSAENIKLGLDLRGGVSITYETDEKNPDATDLADTIYKLQLRVQQYSTDATVYQEGNNRITVEIPGVYDTQTVIEELGRPGSLQFVTIDESKIQTDENADTTGADATVGADTATTPDATVGADVTAAEDVTATISEDAFKVWVTGDQVKNAQAGTQQDSTTGNSQFVVQLTLNEEGAKAFAEATAQNLNKIIYIIYDGEVVSYPTVKSVISDGNCIIEGMESYEKAETLASTIRIGSLKLPLHEISSKVVSAKLGDNAVSTSLIAGAIGILLIIIFMILYFKVPGIAAAIALIFYTAAMLLLLNAFDLTLTISGLAGIILSIGMAVDGNVIINARIKEELEAGRSAQEAIKYGFKKSTSAILDGNITTLIVAIVLLIFGSGTIKGFGMTLAIGIVLSVITSLLVSRLLVSCLYGMGLKDAKHYARVSNKKRAVFDFIGKKFIWFIVGGVLILAGVITMIVCGATTKKALNFNIEFAGGYSTTVDFDKDYSIDDFNDKIKKDIADVIGTKDIEGQKTTGSNQYVIKTPELELSVWNEMKDMLVNNYGADADSISYEHISATVSSELQKDAFISMAIAIVCMLLYIWIRFRKLKFALSSVIALAHDVMIVITFYAIFRLSVGNSFIACILTIVGYSINATIVIFDRIRENLANPEINYDLKLVANTSIQQTLSRSIYTSATTFITVLILYILGVEAMKEFALPLAVGIVAGAFSSIFISGSLFYIMTKKNERYNASLAAKAVKKVSVVEKDGTISEEYVDKAATKPEEIEEGETVKKITANPNKKKKKKRKQ